MSKNESRFIEEVVPKYGKYAGEVIKVSKIRAKRMLAQGKVTKPGKEQKGTGKIKPRLDKKIDKEAENRKDK